jgi:hypothetical protein
MGSFGTIGLLIALLAFRRADASVLSALTGAVALVISPSSAPSPCMVSIVFCCLHP